MKLIGELQSDGNATTDRRWTDHVLTTDTTENCESVAARSGDLHVDGEMQPDTLFCSRQAALRLCRLEWWNISIVPIAELVLLTMATSARPDGLLGWLYLSALAIGAATVMKPLVIATGARMRAHSTTEPKVPLLGSRSYGLAVWLPMAGITVIPWSYIDDVSAVHRSGRPPGTSDLRIALRDIAGLAATLDPEQRRALAIAVGHRVDWSGNVTFRFDRTRADGGTGSGHRPAIVIPEDALPMPAAEVVDRITAFRRGREPQKTEQNQP